MSSTETPAEAKAKDKVVHHVNELDAGTENAQLVPEHKRGELPSVDPAPPSEEVAEEESKAARARARDEEKVAVAAEKSEKAKDSK